MLCSIRAFCGLAVHLRGHRLTPQSMAGAQSYGSGDGERMNAWGQTRLLMAAIWVDLNPGSDTLRQSAGKTPRKGCPGRERDDERDFCFLLSSPSLRTSRSSICTLVPNASAASRQLGFALLFSLHDLPVLFFFFPFFFLLGAPGSLSFGCLAVRLSHNATVRSR
ncbi:hypothetical protein BDY21DRAFT_138437 [Lineolata rhizophorae]|uniref:Uncharacterized protein n=1 Tax=Lineolata rhizophorae TaxID=578093 RepID=A0A6A6PAX0_9PEZI|nr:hypothetical protein BDY21DRAFT_138437 [Lineolata rhizophorae]